MVTLLTFDGVEDVDYVPSDAEVRASLEWRDVDATLLRRRLVDGDWRPSRDGDSGGDRLVLGRRWLRCPRVLVARAGMRAGRGSFDVWRLCGG